MTLLATEIHNHDNPQTGVIVFASDRRITTTGGRYVATRKKIFEVPRLDAALGYFGLAEVGTSSKRISMQDWLEAFLRRNASAPSLAELAETLARELNSVVPAPWRRTVPSGFHLAGFSADGRPEFWFVRNVDDTGSPSLGSYSAREEFQRRDASGLLPGVVMIYRNGDIRAHVAAWQQLDQAFGPLLQTSGFVRLRTPDDYKKWIRFKMEVVSYFYKTFSPKPIIARPIDVILIEAGKSKARRTRR